MTPHCFFSLTLFNMITTIIEQYTMPCSDYPDFIPTPSIPLITSTMSTTSISSLFSLTDILPIIEPSTRSTSLIDPMSSLVIQEVLPPMFIATTQLDDLSYFSIRIHSVDIPIYAHCLINDFSNEQTNAYLSSQLLDSCLATTLDGHMDMGSPLYALYKAFL